MTYNDELHHYGVLGMRWGKRRYTNRDGTLNALGKKRREMQDAKAEKKSAQKAYDQAYNKGFGSDADIAKAAETSNRAKANYKQARKAYNLEKGKRGAKNALIGIGTVSAAAVGTGAFLKYTKVGQAIVARSALMYLAVGIADVLNDLSN